MISEWHCALGSGDIIPLEDITQGCSLSKDATQIWWWGWAKPSHDLGHLRLS